MTYRKKLIEVALPLEAINVASAREKSIRHGHPSTLHLWWARRPLAACRAVLFSSLIDDPSEHPELFPTEEAQDVERQRLFRLIEELVKWESTNDERVLGMARAEIMKATGGNPPPFLDPFAGGGSIPLEAQRLGLEAHASDLNPVAVLINKAMIEIPPKFAGQPPVNPQSRHKISAQSQWRGAQGLAEDVRYYGQWMRDEAYKRMGHLYPKVQLPKEQGGGEATVIAWLWARTVQCPNPACGAQMPLIRSFALSTKAGKKAWVEPVVDRTQEPPKVSFEVRAGNGDAPEAPKVGRGAQFKCLACGTVTSDQYVKSEGMSGRLGTQLMAVVAEGRVGRIYLSPTSEQAAVAAQARPTWRPIQNLPDNARWFSPPIFGMPTYGDLFTPRQLAVLDTLADLVGEVREQIRQDAVVAGLANDGVGIEVGGRGSFGYADAVATYLGMGVGKVTDYNSSLVSWSTSRDQAAHVFTRQALPMLWDYAEVNPFARAAGDLSVTLAGVGEALERSLPAIGEGFARQLDATEKINGVKDPIFSTDPPYYDNIGYADLSDFFYVWLRRSLGQVYPNLFGTIATPKENELVATPYRFGGDRQMAQRFFEDGLKKTFAKMRAASHPDYPLTVYYGYKQAEEDEDQTSSGGSVVASTGWETMLESLISSEFQVTGTWPMRTERSARSISIGTNALASSIILVCRPRPKDAPMTTRRDFINTLRQELPHALKQLQRGNIAPVDLAQAAIGPGMAVFSRYGKVLEASGEAMRVRTALELINQTLGMVLVEQEGEYDRDTRWAVAWFDQRGHVEGPFGEADVLARAKNTSVGGLVESGFLESRGGKARLLKRDELSEDWDPTTDKRLTVWEVTQHLIHALDKQGEDGAAGILRKVGGDYGETARDLAYRMYTTCERKKWAEEALAYNSLVVAWPQITQRASEMQGEAAQANFS